MKHRATARKRPYLVTGAQTLPPAGTAIASDGMEIGEIMTRNGARGLALVRLDRLEEARAPAAENIPVALSRPAWLG